MQSSIRESRSGSAGRRRGLRAAALLFAAAVLVHLGAVGFLRGRPDSVAGLMTVDLLILSGSTAAAAIITRWLPEGEAPAFWAAGFVAMFLFGMLFLATWGQLVR